VIEPTSQKEGKFSTFEYKVFDVEDSPTANIKQYFKEATKFINEARTHGYILIHCPTGNSRAAAICVAYFMDLRLDLSFEDVYETIKYGREEIDINPGFMQQLREYYGELHPIKQVEVEKPPTVPDLVVDVDDWMLKTVEKPSGKPTLQFACKKCRTIIFNDFDLINHQQGGGNLFRGKREYGARTADCTSYFLDEMPWMGSCLETEGKLFCPKCCGKIGSWVWNGTQCSCGAWCVPAFQVMKARVDVTR